MIIGVGCSKTSIVAINKQCITPVSPKLQKLDSSFHIGAKENVNILMLNIADMSAYIKSLEATINCYQDKK